jgi:hypothetical protein
MLWEVIRHLCTMKSVCAARLSLYPILATIKGHSRIVLGTLSWRLVLLRLLFLGWIHVDITRDNRISVEAFVLFGQLLLCLNYACFACYRPYDNFISGNVG